MKKLQEKEPEQNAIKNIINLREQNKLTQDSMAKLLQVKRSRYGAWEEKRAFPPLCHLQKIAEVFGTTIENLTKKKD